MQISYTALRPFMRRGEAEPNIVYRPWLEENVGYQGVDWDWKIHSVTDNTLSIMFSNRESATLFELVWP